MQRCLILLLFVIIACKKNEDTPRVTIRQQPSKLAVFVMDTSTGMQTLQYEINYFYDDSLKRFDSIDVAGSMYRFNYSAFTTEKKMLLNYTNASSPYNVINFDANFYSLSSYQELSNSSTITKIYAIQYDTYKKITGLSFVSSNSSDNYTKDFFYRNDSTFIRTNKPAASCDVTDTLISTYVYMGTTLPYLSFLDITKDCSALEDNILKAMPISNYVNRLPYKISNSIYETSYSYVGDAESRLKDATISIRLKSNNKLHQKIKMTFSY